MRSSVLFPVPLRPSSATNSPGAIERSSPRRTPRSPKVRVTPLAKTAVFAVTCTGVVISSSLESVPPDQQVPFERPDDRVGDQAEDRVDREAEEHDVGAVRGLRLVDEVAETALRVDLLRHHVNDPHGDKREAQADQ